MGPLNYTLSPRTLYQPQPDQLRVISLTSHHSPPPPYLLSDHRQPIRVISPDFNPRQHDVLKRWLVDQWATCTAQNKRGGFIQAHGQLRVVQRSDLDLRRHCHCWPPYYWRWSCASELHREGFLRIRVKRWAWFLHYCWVVVVTRLLARATSVIAIKASRPKVASWEVRWAQASNIYEECKSDLGQYWR